LLVGRPSYRINSTASKAAKDRGETSAARTARWLEGASFADLPGTQKEVEQIAAVLKKSAPVEIYLGDKAREEIIKKSTDAGILHIATHGFFISEQANEFEKYTRKEDNFSDPMLRSGIVLAGVEDFQRTGTSEADDDGILTAMEVCNLQLENTELVVMSACETGLGEIRYGEGVYGLQRAFRIAGARAMIMSLWKVDDQATQEMMVLFYNNWLKFGDKRKAFEEAQKEIRKKYKYPFYWGAFVLLGE
jgi:CHAT domain-containing protein